ncbi:Zinc finger transcription factor [Drechslerella dactyloides]|uniref:Zinc finger transcription factor n=1 Tax=Drechslerella dactyloides TaxID=74499 RepID=A0AAD6IUN6_DREDA|nr:Zinc finger transcription factor [Drechslerella dactyloides]
MSSEEGGSQVLPSDYTPSRVAERVKNADDVHGGGSSASTVRRNSFAGLDKPAKPAADDKKAAPKSVGGIDSLIDSVAKIAISKEDDKTIDAAAPKVIAAPKVSSTAAAKPTTKPTKKAPAPAPKTLEDDDGDVELSSKSAIIEDVTASYVSSMKEILSSFDRTLQLSDSTTEKKVILTRSQPTVVKKEKDTALPLPRFLITGAANDDGIRVPIKRRTMPAMKKETSDSVKSPSSVTAAVDEKEVKEVKEEKSGKTQKPIKQEPEKDAARPRRARSRTNPFEEGDIIRSSRAPLPRRRFVPQDTTPYSCNTGGMNMANNHFGEIDAFLAGAGNRNSMSQLDLYGFPDLSSANLNLGLDTNLAGEGDIYNSFSASPTPELIDSTEVDAGLGVYSSPVQPLTPPSTTNLEFAQGGLTSPYGSPQTAGVYYATNNLPVNQNWSTQPSTIGSPSGSVLSAHSTTPTGLSTDAIMEMKRLILLPLSQDHTVLQFTPLIAAASMRLDEGRILCLRDLEKYLLYKSQEMSPSPQTLLMFCEKFLFRCQAAMPSIEAVGGDLTRPNDTPYYEGYFMDVLANQKEALLSQMVSASTAAAPAPAITILQRPVSAMQGPPMPKPMAPQNGIRKMTAMHRPHSSINEKLQDQLLMALEQRASMGELATLGGLFDLSARDLPISPVSQPQELTGGSDNDSDDNQTARTLLMGGKRKKSIQKPQGGHVCLHRDEETGAICGKKYNRPCDLKKHGKTHSRPHKCSEPTCLYHEKGFPTEKERDRHETDRHSESPQMWYCEFPPCPYKSKRESNCKQHMEKQHDYHYERSKHNPRNPNGNAVKTSQQQNARKNSDGSVKPINVSGKPMALFDHGISTPPQDVNAYLPTLDETNEMAKIQQMYLLTPSPDTPQTFRSASVDSTADMQQQQQQQQQQQHGDLSGVYSGNWNQFNTWQQIPTTGAGWMGNPGLIVE